jgi:hypothetical protein
MIVVTVAQDQRTGAATSTFVPRSQNLMSDRRRLIRQTRDALRLASSNSARRTPRVRAP